MMDTFNHQISADKMRISTPACGKMAELFATAEDEVEAIRVFIYGGGCGGMSYSMTFTDSKTPYDSVLEGEGYKIYVDPVALNYLDGVEIDYQESATGASFVFHNAFAVTGGSGGCPSCGAAGGGDSGGGGCA